MKLISMWVLPFIYLYVAPVYSKDITLDLSQTKNSKSIIVTPSKLPMHAKKYIFRTKNWNDSFSVIKYDRRIVPIKRNMKIKEAVFYRFDWLKLLSIKNSRHKWLLKGGDGAYLYFSAHGRDSWQSITLRQFKHLYFTNAYIGVQLDLGKPEKYAKINSNKDGSFTYTKREDEIYITRIKSGIKYIWPYENQKGAIFLDAAYKETKEGTLLRVRYEDVDNKKKTSYHLFNGKDWGQISNRRGRRLMS